MASETLHAGAPGLSRSTRIALGIVLIAYPALYCAGFMGPIVRAILDGSRIHWWQFWLINLGFHLTAFGAVFIALKQSGESWSSVGLDPASWRRWRLPVGLLFAALAAGAWLLPDVYYNGAPPAVSQTHFMGPVTRWERLMVLAGAFVVGVTEEVLFRGFALTRLKRVMPLVAAVAISTVSFVFIHGTPRSAEGVFSYVSASLLFALPFIWMNFRRLEWLILIHFLVDASLVLAP